MTTMWASPADLTGGTADAVFSAEFHWCSVCSDDELFDRPEGSDSPEAFCVSCGNAVFLWVDSAEEIAAGWIEATVTWAEAGVDWVLETAAVQPAARSRTPARAVATPAA